MSWFRRIPHVRERSTLTPLRSSSITDKVKKQVIEGVDQSNTQLNQPLQEQKRSENNVKKD